MRNFVLSIYRTIMQFAHKLPYHRYILFGILLACGIVGGIAVKIIAQKTIIIGYNDYLLQSNASYINLNDIAQHVVEKIPQQNTSVTTGDTCTN